MSISTASSRIVLDKSSRTARNKKVSNVFRALLSPTRTQLHQNNLVYPMKDMAIVSPRLYTTVISRDNNMFHSTIYSHDGQIFNQEYHNSGIGTISSIYHYVQTPINLAVSYIRSLINIDFFTSGIFLIKRTYQPRYVKLLLYPLPFKQSLFITVVFPHSLVSFENVVKLVFYPGRKR